MESKISTASEDPPPACEGDVGMEWVTLEPPANKTEVPTAATAITLRAPPARGGPMWRR